MGLLHPPWAGRAEDRQLGTHPVPSPREGPPTPQLTSGMHCPCPAQVGTTDPLKPQEGKHQLLILRLTEEGINPSSPLRQTKGGAEPISP